MMLRRKLYTVLRVREWRLLFSLVPATLNEAGALRSPGTSDLDVKYPGWGHVV